jgi:hypothetical protein
MEPQYDFQDMAIHDLSVQRSQLIKQRDALLVAARQALAFLHTVEWEGHPHQPESLDVRVALDVAITDAADGPKEQP